MERLANVLVQKRFRGAGLGLVMVRAQRTAGPQPHLAEARELSVILPRFGDVAHAQIDLDEVDMPGGVLRHGIHCLVQGHELSEALHGLVVLPGLIGVIGAEDQPVAFGHQCRLLSVGRWSLWRWAGDLLLGLSRAGRRGNRAACQRQGGQQGGQ